MRKLQFHHQSDLIKPDTKYGDFHISPTTLIYINVKGRL